MLLGLGVGSDEESATLAICHDFEGDRAATWRRRMQRERPTHVFRWADQGSVRARCDDLQELLGRRMDRAAISFDDDLEHQCNLTSVPFITRIRPAIWAKSATT